jgi:DNA-directed RNA polymerase specialized sigma subunit
MPELKLEQEFQQPYNEWKTTPNQRTTGALLKAVDPILESAIKTYGGRVHSPNLRSQAKLMALDAFQRYDPTRAKLRTHLMSHLQGLRRVAAQEGQIIHIPERVGLDLHRLRVAEAELRDIYGRDPSDMELADHTGLSRKRITYIRKALPGISEGSISGVPTEEDQINIGPAVHSPADQAWYDFVYHDLHPVDQVIMEHTLGLHGKQILSKQQIANKLRLSPGAISQRASKIQDKLNKREELGISFF